MDRQVTIPRDDASFNQVGRELSKTRRLWDAGVLWARAHKDAIVGAPLILGASTMGFWVGLFPGLCAVSVSAFLASLYADKTYPREIRPFGDKCFMLGAAGLSALGFCGILFIQNPLPISKHFAERANEWRATNRILAGENRALESGAYREWLEGYGEKGTATTLLSRQCTSADGRVIVIRNDSDGGPFAPKHFSAFVKEARPGGIDEWVEKKMTPALAVCRR